MVMNAGNRSHCRTGRTAGPAAMSDQRGAIGDPGLSRSVAASTTASADPRRAVGYPLNPFSAVRQVFSSNCAALRDT
jgi:hypothetical protein